MKKEESDLKGILLIGAVTLAIFALYFVIHFAKEIDQWFLK